MHGIKYNYHAVFRYFSKYHYRLISSSYHNSLQKLSYQCPVGHSHAMSFNDFKNKKRRCPTCNSNSSYLSRQIDPQQVKDTFNLYAYTLIDFHYKNRNTIISSICPNGHECKITYSSFQRGRRCSQCRHPKTMEHTCRSIIERIIGMKFPITRPKFLKNPNTNRSLELDGYNEQLKLAFEYNGEFHDPTTRAGGLNQIKAIEQHKRDQLKQQLCEFHGIHLISIPYYTENIEQFLIKELLKLGFHVKIQV